MSRIDSSNKEFLKVIRDGKIAVLYHLDYGAS